MDLEKVYLLGPYPPQKGGIANHTRKLHQHLLRHIPVKVFAYRDPFPKCFFPGIHQGLIDNEEEDVSFNLSYKSPQSWNSTAQGIKDEDANAVLIIIWWSFFYSFHFKWLIYKLRKSRTRIVFLCHNTFDHNGSPLKKLISRQCLSQPAGYIFHSEGERKKISDYAGDSNSLVFPHPINTPKPPAENQSSTNRTSSFQILFFGIIRPYKGIDVLIEALKLIHSTRVHLTIAGEWWKGQDALKATCQELHSQGKLTLRDHYLSDDEVKKLMAATDVLILPYKSATNSGVLAQAFEYQKPAIVTDVGTLPEHISDGKNGYVVAPDNPNKLADAIMQAEKDWSERKSTSVQNSQIHDLYSWDRFAEATYEFIRKPKMLQPFLSHPRLIFD